MEAEEEREAMVLQKRLLDHMSEEHFNMDKFVKCCCIKVCEMLLYFVVW